VIRHELAHSTPDHGAVDLLTSRQCQAIWEYVYHENAREASACMGISYQTFKNHVSAIHERLEETTTLGVFRRLGYLSCVE
jgi:DNA-binding CsgD family transcriptional regulator